MYSYSKPLARDMSMTEYMAIKSLAVQKHTNRDPSVTRDIHYSEQLGHTTVPNSVTHGPEYPRDIKPWW